MNTDAIWMKAEAWREVVGILAADTSDANDVEAKNMDSMAAAAMDSEVEAVVMNGVLF